MSGYSFEVAEAISARELEAHAHQAGIHVVLLAPLPAMLAAAGATAGSWSLAAGGLAWLVGQLCLGLALLRTGARGARLATLAATVTAVVLLAVGALVPGPTLFVLIPAAVMIVATLPLRRLARAFGREPLPRARLRS